MCLEERRRGERPDAREARALALVVIALISVAGCGLLARRAAPGDLSLATVSAPVVSRADEGAFALRNTSGGPLVIPHPSAPFILVSGASGEGRALRCRTAPAPGEDVSFMTLAPGSEVPLRIDLLSRCDVGQEEDFRFVVRFAVPGEIRSRPGGERSWVGVTPPAHLQVARAPGR